MDSVQNRKFVILAIFILVGMIYVTRLIYVQIFDEDHKKWALTVSQRSLRILPDRGVVFDRNGKVLVKNENSYDLCITPADFGEEDSAEIGQLLNMSIEELRAILNVTGIERIVPQKAISGLEIE